MFVLVLFVPALLVVLLGYVVGYEIVMGIGGHRAALERPAEAIGWVTGIVLLVALVWSAVLWRRRVRRRRG